MDVFRAYRAGVEYHDTGYSAPLKQHRENPAFTVLCCSAEIRSLGPITHSSFPGGVKASQAVAGP